MRPCTSARGVSEVVGGILGRAASCPVVRLGHRRLARGEEAEILPNRLSSDNLSRLQPHHELPYPGERNLSCRVHWPKRTAIGGDKRPVPHSREARRERIGV